MKFKQATITSDEFVKIRTSFRFDQAIMNFRELASIRGISYNPNLCIKTWMNQDGSVTVVNYVNEPGTSRK